MDRAKIPATLTDDESLIGLIEERYGSERWMFIPNTLHLEELYVSADLRDELSVHPLCSVADKPTEMSFSDRRLQLFA
jgi:hypothetical protein